MDIGQILVGLGGGGILASAVNALLNRRKLGADTASVLSKAAANLVQPLSDQIDRLEAKVKALEGRVTSLTDELDAAHDSNRAKDSLIAELTRTDDLRAHPRPRLKKETSRDPD
jgi:outer membrane murein-binding lipoprotein Lpp